MSGRRRPSACPQGHDRIRRRTITAHPLVRVWWCWVCNCEVPERERPTSKLARGRVKPKGPERKRARTRLRAFGTDARMEWLHSLPCVGHGAPGHVCDPWDMETGRAVIQAVHVKARGAGGTADHQVPGCAALHREAGEYGTSQRATFERTTGLDLMAKAADYAAAWREIEALRDIGGCASVAG